MKDLTFVCQVFVPGFRFHMSIKKLNMTRRSQLLFFLTSLVPVSAALWNNGEKTPSETVTVSAIILFIMSLLFPTLLLYIPSIFIILLNQSMLPFGS